KEREERDPGETTLEVEAVPLHKEKGEAKAGHDRHKKKVQLIRGDPLFLGNAIESHSRERAHPECQQKPPQHRGSRAAKAVQKPREKEERNHARAEVLKNSASLIGDIVADFVSKSPETERVEVDSDVAHMAG